MKNTVKFNSLVRSMLLYMGIGIGIIILLFSLSGCTDTCTTTTSYTLYEPVYESMSSLRLEVEILPPQSRESQGKIYIYGDYLLLGDPGKGIHIFDNKDKTNPQAISFVKIPGNVDVAGRIHKKIFGNIV